MFRGQKTDKAVLCTKNKTFDIKEAETSNSLLIIPKLKFAEDISSELAERDIEDKEVFILHLLFRDLMVSFHCFI